MKKKLKIGNLKVSSFVTDDEKDSFRGGLKSNERTCYLSVVYCVSVNAYCPTRDFRC